MIFINNFTFLTSEQSLQEMNVIELGLQGWNLAYKVLLAFWATGFRSKKRFKASRFPFHS